MSHFFHELTRIRRFLRDPDGKIWSDDLLIALWNEVQRDIQLEHGLLEEVRVLSSPPKYHISHLYDWEFAYTGVGQPIFRALQDQGGHYVFTAQFEVEIAQFGIGSFSGVQGRADGFTHPFEVWFADIGSLVDWPLPIDFHAMKGIYYDEWPIAWQAPRGILRIDPTWQTREGTAQWYTRRDVVSNTITLYPRPSSVAWNDENDPAYGLVADIEDDTFLSELGIITGRTDSFLSLEVGVSVSVLEVSDNLLIIYSVMPVDINSVGDELVWPDWIQKYIRFGVLGRAYKANTDGRIPSLARYWDNRYELGLRALKKYQAASKEDRDYQLRTRGVPSRQIRRHPRLPDTYPSVFP